VKKRLSSYVSVFELVTSNLSDIFKDLSPDPIAVLPAPCYIYSVRFFPQNPDLVFLAGQNGFIYVFCLDQDHPQLIQELSVGKTIINSICFNLNATVLYATADDGFLYSFPIEQVNFLWLAKMSTRFK